MESKDNLCRYCPMKLIALDQNVVSNLASPPSIVWSEILDLLKVGVRQGTVICPTPTETISESVHLDRTRREGIERVCADLSQGYFFRFPWEIIAPEALAKIRPGTDTFPFWIPQQINKGSDVENEVSSQAIWKDKVNFEKTVNIELSREERSAIRSSGSKQFPADHLAYLSAIEWLRLVRGYLNKLRNDQLLGDEQFIIQQICGVWIDLQVTDKEITGLLRSIQNGQWFEIPMLACWFALDGLFMYDQLHRGRRFEYNDEWDKYRAGEAFHCTHCFITDRSMASALRQLKFANPKYFHVFSATEATIIVAYLKTII